jgi:hypothetical protein
VDPDPWLGMWLVSYLELGGEEHAERDPDHPAHHGHKPEDERNPEK